MRAPDAAEVLAAGRITVFGIWFVHVLGTPVELFGQIPHDLFTARGVMRVVPDDVYQALFSSPALLAAFKGLLLVGCLLLVAGVRPFRWIAVPTVLLLLLFDGMAKGFNAWVNHGQMGILFGAVILCLFPAADALSVHGRRRVGAAPPALYAGGVVAVAAFLGAAYAFIGTHRVIHGGVSIFTGDAIVTYMAVQSLNYSVRGFEFGLLPLTYPLLATLFKAGYAVTTVFEILTPLCLVNTWFRRAWLVVIVPFHVSTLFTMNIFFWENILLILVFVAPLGYVLAEPGGTSARFRLPGLRVARSGDRAASAAPHA